MGGSKGDVMITQSRLKVAAAIVTLVAATTTASANPLNPFEALFGPLRPQVTAPAYANPSEDAKELRSDLQRQVVDYRTSEALNLCLEKAAKDAGASIEVVGFARFQLGEGIEKKADDFAAEVAKMAG